MSLSDSLMPDRTPGRQQEAARSETSSTPALSPTDRLFARTDANLDGEFAGILGAGGPEARAALEHAASTEGRAAYTRFQADPDAFGTVIGNRERAFIVGGASDALAYSKAVYAADQAGRTPSVPGYDAAVQANGQAPTVSAGVEPPQTQTPENAVGHEPQRAEPSIEPEPVRYEMPYLGPWVSTDPANRLGSPTVTTETTRSVEASRASGATGRFFDSRGRPVGNDGSTEDRRYLVNDRSARYLRQNNGVGSVADIRAAGGAVYEIREMYASYESIDNTFERQSGARQESHAALSISATGADIFTSFGTVTARNGESSNVGRSYNRSDFVRISSEVGPGASVAFIAHDHPPDMNAREEDRPALMNNPT